jgi:hypothetical protein
MDQNKSELVIYKDSDGPEIRVSVHDQTVWLAQSEISEVFGTQRPAITKHLKNIFKSGELQEKQVCSILEHTADDGKKYKVQYYNLDAILAVGYRVNSKKATQFRIWATQKLRDYLIKGYVVNEKRMRENQEAKLNELQKAHTFITKALEAKRLSGYEKDLANIINDYTQTWVILNRYDDGDLELDKEKSKNVKEMEYARAKKAIEHFKSRMVEHDLASGTFGRERGTTLAVLLENLTKSKIGLSEKAATIFYSIIKSRPFLDGNKRIASLLFVLFLIENNILYDKKGERKFNDNALIALALLIEETKPSEKEIVIQLVSNLVSKK